MSDFRRFRGTIRYLTNDSLEAAVNCALALERPLLVKGEPGTGKTLLAEAIAESLEARLLTWHVKSTTRAQDGLYVYDTVQRLYDSRFEDGDVRDIRRYIKLGPLGEALKADDRVVLLIDEVDKADLEFPNDCSNELEPDALPHHRDHEDIASKQRPVVIITSNNEKELTDAFLRRCVFHFIDSSPIRSSCARGRGPPTGWTRASSTRRSRPSTRPQHESPAQAPLHQRAHRMDRGVRKAGHRRRRPGQGGAALPRRLLKRSRTWPHSPTRSPAASRYRS